jgi:hypothetical protein
MSRSKPHLVADSGAHIIRKSRVNILSTKYAKIIIGDKATRQQYYFEPIPKNFWL